MTDDHEPRVLTHRPRCKICLRPVTGDIHVGRFIDNGRLVWEGSGHQRCVRAVLDADAMELARVWGEACAAGYHEFPGQWTRDPSDPYDDARYWVCARGCGHVQRHPGYGHGRILAIIELFTSDEFDRYLERHGVSLAEAAR
ncbi:hypothetical protein [Actinomadura sp. K4S16]|uniref:hypothetical protein n=1 Tax=Actinomadura sp. K4S16 TaxID=1316147 RepID=UPI0011EF86E8|nr:hypothetical protein [Actinomadura sp. K4S16]